MYEIKVKNRDGWVLATQKKYATEKEAFDAVLLLKMEDHASGEEYMYKVEPELGTLDLGSLLARLGVGEVREYSSERLSLMEFAANHGADDALLKKIAWASKSSRSALITLSPHRFENLSRGWGWARKGKGKQVEWGERVSEGYRVSAGTWTVGGGDGFSRKGQTVYTVETFELGGQTFTLATE